MTKLFLIITETNKSNSALSVCIGEINLVPMEKEECITLVQEKGA